MNVLFVCTGNTCRSPLAEALARKLAPELGLDGAAFASAGIDVWVEGGPATPEALRVGRERGLDLSGHRAQTLTGALVDWADVILAMSPEHAERAEELGAGEKAVLLAPGAVEDPWGRGIDAYRRTTDGLEEAIRCALPDLVRRT